MKRRWVRSAHLFLLFLEKEEVGPPPPPALSGRGSRQEDHVASPHTPFNQGPSFVRFSQLFSRWPFPRALAEPRLSWALRARSQRIDEDEQRRAWCLQCLLSANSADRVRQLSTLPLSGVGAARARRLHDTVSEWPRRWTRNPLGSARRGSNPLAVGRFVEAAKASIAFWERGFAFNPPLRTTTGASFWRCLCCKKGPLFAAPKNLPQTKCLATAGAESK